MPTTTYADLVDHQIIDRARELHADSQARLAQAEAAVAAATAAVADAERAANLAAAGEGELSALDAERALADRQIELASAVRVRDAAQARHARTHKNLGASESMAYRPVAIAAGRARLAACEKFTRAHAMLAEADREYQAAERDGGQPARARGIPTAETGLGHARPLAEERLAWNSIRHAFDLDAGTFGGMPAGYIA